MRKTIYALMGLVLAVVASQAQITYKPAFGTLTFSSPVAMAEMPGKPGHFVVVEKATGIAYLVSKSGTTWSKSIFYQIPGGVHQSLEQGFLGFTFHPNYAANHKYYIMYCPKPAFSNIFEERVADATGMKDGGGKGVELIHLKDPYENHNAGCLGFGKDGLLYLSTGDGGKGGDPQNRAQNKDSLFGKILRIDVDHKGNAAYGIPSDNPFANGGGRPEIYAWGLRNPWKFSFDALTGELWLGEVGQNKFEEVDVVEKGRNYGWNVYEADACYQSTCGSKTGFDFPIYSYPHTDGNAIIGGYVYRGDPASPFYGKYFFSDNGSSTMWTLTKSGAKATVATVTKAPAKPSSFGTDARGGLYLVGLGDGTIYEMLPGNDSPTGLLPGNGFLRDATGRTYQSAPGRPLAASAFHGEASLGVFALGGARMATLSLAEGVNLPAGLYLMKTAASKPDLLIVR